MNTKAGEELTECIETTVGELIEAITQIALETGRSEQEGYTLAALTIERILDARRRRIGTLIQ